MQSRFALLISALTAFVLVSATLAMADDQQNVSLKNEFIRVVVNQGPNEAGRFSVDTTGGDPTRPASKGQQLIYGGNTPWTSFTTVRIDNTNYVFGGKTSRRAGLNANYGDLVSGPTVTGDSITTVCKYGDVLVTQELSFVRGASSRMLDTLGVSYRFDNQGKTSHQVGLRVMLDTKLGPNDGAPVRAGVQAIKNAMAIVGNDIPAYWQAFDSLDNPTIISQGTLYGSSSNTVHPDKVIFADWGTLADDIWEPTLDPRLGFHRKGEWDPDQDSQDADDDLDTATALYWNPTVVDAGKSITYVTNYGLGYVNVHPGKLAVGITAPADSTFEYERTQPITVTGYLKNQSDFEARNINFSLKLPEGVKLISGSPLTSNILTMKPGEEYQASWILAPTGKVSGKVTIKLGVTSDNIEANEATWDIQLNVPKAKLTLSPASQVLTKGTTQSKSFVVHVKLLQVDDFYGTRFTLTYDPSILRPLLFSPVERGTAFMGEDGRYLDGWSYDTSEKGKIKISAVRRGAAELEPQAETVLAGIQFRVIGTGKCPISLEQAVIINDKGVERPVATTSGLIEVQPEPAQ